MSEAEHVLWLSSYRLDGVFMPISTPSPVLRVPVCARLPSALWIKLVKQQDKFINLINTLQPIQQTCNAICLDRVYVGDADSEMNPSMKMARIKRMQSIPFHSHNP